MEQDLKDFLENGVGGAGAGGRRRKTQGHEDMLSLAAKRKKEEAANLEKQANRLRTINEKYNRLQKLEEDKRKVRCAKINEKCKVEKAKLKKKKHEDLEAADIAFYDAMDKMEEKKEADIRKLLGV